MPNKTQKDLELAKSLENFDNELINNNKHPENSSNLEKELEIKKLIDENKSKIYNFKI